MGELVASPWTVWGIAAAATAGVIARPFAWPEFIWAVTGAVLLVALGLLPIRDALTGVAKGTDVYLFLVGMMLLAELARQEGLFDWLAACAARLARGSAIRLFTLVFVVGTIVTAFLSNDATAVVLTPAVAAVVKTAKAREALPYLFICAFVANAASFVLPISNPANLVIYGSHMPPLLRWLTQYSLPSALSIVTTYLVLRWTQRAELQRDVSADIEVPELSKGGTTAAFGIVGTAVVLLMSSAFDIQLGLPTFIAGVVTAMLVCIRARRGSLRPSAGLAEDRRDERHRRTAAPPRAEFRQLGGVVIRDRPCRGLQPRQQPSRWAGRGQRGADHEGAGACALGGAHRGRSRPQPVGHRLLGDDPLADGAAARGANRRCLDLPEARHDHDADGPRPVARGGLRFRLMIRGE
jgi:hypothetical protein